ncbi:MAG: radical SAM protein [Chloroflexota bacterium]
MSDGYIAYGPVPSRRLGQSIGVNNIPPKTCSYACIYCQLGPTSHMDVTRDDFYDPADIVREVNKRLRHAQNASARVDFVTFVADGEPTLDRRLGQEIDLVKNLGVKVAVISNTSLITDPCVRQDLSRADWVSLKVDAADEDTWRHINRPHGSLGLDRIQAGAREFSAAFRGELATETMLVHRVNDAPEQMDAIADFLGQLELSTAYISVPTRPPALPDATAASEDALTTAHQVFLTRVPAVELLTGYEGNAFAYTGDARADLLSITAVHPMREDAVRELLQRCGADWHVVQDLVNGGQLKQAAYQGRTFFLRTLPKTRTRSDYQ